MYDTINHCNIIIIGYVHCVLHLYLDDPHINIEEI